MVSTSHHTRHFCVRAGLSTPDGLPNLRDLASAAPHRLRPNKLYRGATPAYLPSVPSPEALAFLRSTPVLLDLRSGGERATDHRQTLLTACGPDFPQREVHIGLLSKLQVVSGLARSMPLDSALGLAWHMISRPHRAREAIVGHIDEGGLLLVNRILIELGSAAIGRALHVIADAVSGCGDDDESKSENAAQCYFYCSAGKDRTGMLAALILEVLGVDRADILRDYARSSETWENGPPELLARQDYCGTVKDKRLRLSWKDLCLRPYADRCSLTSRFIASSP